MAQRSLRLLAVASGLSSAPVGAASSSPSKECEALSDQMARLNPGFWTPSFVFRSLFVHPGAIHAPNFTRSTRSAELLGACSPLNAETFEWSKPTSDGGDWIASTDTQPIQINVDGIPCPLTGLAVTTLGYPSLRLQFDACPRKTAVEVPLVNRTGGIHLVHWMCRVTVGSNLCEQASKRLTLTDKSTVWPTQMELDLSLLPAVTAEGVTRMQVYETCYENLDWFVVNSPLAIDPAEWEMLLALRSVLMPPAAAQKTLELKANVVVETVCMADCSGQVAKKCSATVPVTQPISDLHTDEESYDTLMGFVQRASEPTVLPWLLVVLALCALIGCCLGGLAAPHMVQKKVQKDRRVKSVMITHDDGTVTMHSGTGAGYGPSYQHYYGS